MLKFMDTQGNIYADTNIFNTVIIQSLYLYAHCLYAYKRVPEGLNTYIFMIQIKYTDR